MEWVNVKRVVKRLLSMYKGNGEVGTFVILEAEWTGFIDWLGMEYEERVVKSCGLDPQ